MVVGGARYALPDMGRLSGQVNVERVPIFRKYEEYDEATDTEPGYEAWKWCDIHRYDQYGCCWAGFGTEYGIADITDILETLDEEFKPSASDEELVDEEDETADRVTDRSQLVKVTTM